MNSLTFAATRDVLDLGVKVLTARITGVKNSKSNDEFEKFLHEELQGFKKFWKDKDYKEDKILQGFRDLHTKIGKSNRKFPASPEVLLELFLETGRFPRISTLVDIYNLVSVKTRLALGAHDLDKIIGNVTLRKTFGDEKFFPLGSIEKVPVPPGEYAYIDDGNNIICRMEVLQVEPTKITLNSKNVFLIIQGNANTSKEYLESGAKEVLGLITKYCNGEYTFF